MTPTAKTTIIMVDIFVPIYIWTCDDEHRFGLVIKPTKNTPMITISMCNTAATKASNRTLNDLLLRTFENHKDAKVRIKAVITRRNKIKKNFR